MGASTVQSVITLPAKHLLVTFVNGVLKIYDCNPLLRQRHFQSLKHEALFQAVAVDVGGYGIVWNDDVDLSEYELWHNGVEVDRETIEPILI